MSNKLNPYLRLMRLHQPTGIYLLLWPCFWGIALAGSNSLKFYILFALGAVIMRGGGCVINDLWDRKLDREVERTKTRPLASGEISLRDAIAFLLLLLALGLTILLMLPHITIMLGLASMVLVVSYPLMKRITFWPQLFLGFTFNFGALMGYAAAIGGITTADVLLYAAAIFWTLGYDTIYAFQDIEYDRTAGIKSSALRLERQAKPALMIIYGICATLITISFAVANTGWPAFAGLIAFTAHLYWQIHNLDQTSPASARVIFQSNRMAGAILWLGLFIANITS